MQRQGALREQEGKMRREVNEPVSQISEPAGLMRIGTLCMRISGRHGEGSWHFNKWAQGLLRNGVLTMNPPLSHTSSR